MRGINAFCRWLHQQGHIDTVIRLGPQRLEKRLLPLHSVAALRLLLGYRPKTFDRWPVHAIACTILDTGCRIDELLTARVTDFDFNNLLLTVVGKGRKQRKVPFSIELRKLLFRFGRRLRVILCCASELAMYFDNHLTPADLGRAAASPYNNSPTVMAAALIAQLEAISIMSSEYIVPVAHKRHQPGSRESVFVGLYLRLLGFCHSAIELKDPIHHQSVISAARSVIEIYVDMELLHRNVLVDGVERVIAFIDVQKLRAAKRIDRFFATHPHLDQAKASSPW